MMPPYKMELPQIEAIELVEALDSNAAKFDLNVVVIQEKDNNAKRKRERRN